MAQFLVGRFQAFYPGTTNPLVGGQVFTYIGGSTPSPSNYVATYPTIVDANAKTNANTNPIILDANGSASIVCSGATLIMLYDANNNLIWSEDNFDSGEANIVDFNGNTLVSFTSTPVAVNYINIANAATGNGPTISSSGSDTAVPLNIGTQGSASINILNNLNMDGNNIISGNNQNISITPGTSGKLILSGTSYPTSLGTPNYALTTDGAGNASFSNKLAQVGINQPKTAFLAYHNTTQAINNNTITQVLFNTKVYDTGSLFTTNNTYTPNVAGTYLLQTYFSFSGFFAANVIMEGYIYKNGVAYVNNIAQVSVATFPGSVLVSCPIQANGTTDYFTAYLYQNSGGSLSLSSGLQGTWFSAVLVEAT